MSGTLWTVSYLCFLSGACKLSHLQFLHIHAGIIRETLSVCNLDVCLLQFIGQIIPHLSERENEWERELEMKENWMKAGFVDGEPPRKIPNQRHHSLPLIHVSIHSNLLPIWRSPWIPISPEHLWKSFFQWSHWALDKTRLQPARLPTDYIHPCPWMLLKNRPVPCK